MESVDVMTAGEYLTMDWSQVKCCVNNKKNNAFMSVFKI